MTEQEAISVLKDFDKQVAAKADGAYRSTIAMKACELAITALEEIKQYRTIGTVEEITKINDFFNTQTAKILAKLQEYERTGLTPQEIMDGKMLTGWIPVEEKLPEEPDAGLIEMEDLQEYIVVIDGVKLSTVLSYAGNGEWYRDGNFYKVIAWMPLPEPYRPEAEAKMTEMEGAKP